MAIKENPVATLQSVEIELFTLLAARIGVKKMIDVGAHHGTSLRPFLEAGWSVVAFEPIEANRSVLADQFGGARLTIRPEAVSDKSGVKLLHLAEHLDGTPHEYYHSLERIGNDQHHQKGRVIKVPVVSLNDLAARGEIPRHVGFLKIDTEGHDLAVLRGALQLNCEVISVEFWREGHALGPSPSPPDAMIELMAAHGYASYLAVCHEGESTTLHKSTLAGTRADAWGNLLFVRPENQPILDEAAAICAKRRSATPAAPAPPSLLHELLERVFESKDNPLVVDVGAFRGDFTGRLLQQFPGAQAILVEPTPTTCAELHARFDGNPAIQIVNVALGAERACADFYIAEHPYQNSLLVPTDCAAEKTTVAVETLDHLREAWPHETRIDFLKIDAQGHDRRILDGAVQTIARDRPAILVEVIFVPLYEGQGSCFQIMQFFGERSYELAGIFQPHTTEHGLLAYADLLFLPAEIHRRLHHQANPQYACLDADVFKQRIADLQTACDERLHVIHRLDAALRNLRPPKSAWRALKVRMKQVLQKMRARLKR